VEFLGLPRFLLLAFGEFRIHLLLESLDLVQNFLSQIFVLVFVVERSQEPGRFRFPPLLEPAVNKPVVLGQVSLVMKRL